MAMCAALILVVPAYWMLLVVLAIFGLGMATLDVAMNAEASAVEKALGQPIMSSLHGMFSVGGMFGRGGRWRAARRTAWRQRCISRWPRRRARWSS